MNILVRLVSLLNIRNIFETGMLQLCWRINALSSSKEALNENIEKGSALHNSCIRKDNCIKPPARPQHHNQTNSYLIVPYPTYH